MSKRRAVILRSTAFINILRKNSVKSWNNTQLNLISTDHYNFNDLILNINSACYWLDYNLEIWDHTIQLLPDNKKYIKSELKDNHEGILFEAEDQTIIICFNTHVACLKRNFLEISTFNYRFRMWNNKILT